MQKPLYLDTDDSLDRDLDVGGCGMQAVTPPIGGGQSDETNAWRHPMELKAWR